MEKANTTRLQMVEEGIGTRIILSLKYRSANGNITQRMVEPLALYYVQDRWTMIAYCKLRKDYREFKMGNVIELEKTSDSFPPNQFELSHFYSKS